MEKDYMETKEKIDKTKINERDCEREIPVLRGGRFLL